MVDFNIPADITAYLTELDAFIEREIKPLERENDNIRFFDHRREWARTDFDRGGLPRHEWEALLGEMRRRADKAGHYRFALPREFGGKDESVKYALERKPFGKALATNQAIQWPLVELHTEAAMIRALIYKTAWEMDQMSKPEVAKRLSDKVAMCNYRANRLVCEAADRAMQVHGGMGYSRHKPFEHIYRHHRRYRITEGAEEIQMRRVAQILFGFGSRAKSQD
jgi:alkylation response protein AidB-like acyl-CoA dehydrogenase